MSMVSIPYGFIQRFELPAAAAFAWATDYDPADIERMGKKGRRAIERLTADALVLNDTYEADTGSAPGRGTGVVRKRRLVRIYPDLMLWTNTRLSGPNKHSQFLYRIVPEGRAASRLEFAGLLLVASGEAPTTARGIAALGRKLARTDALIWKHLARVMATELGRSSPRRSTVDRQLEGRARAEHARPARATKRPASNPRPGGVRREPRQS